MPLRLAVTFIVTFLAWAAASVLSQLMGDVTTLNSSVWLATGVTFGALLVCKPAIRPAVLLAALVAATSQALFDGLALAPALGFGLIEVLGASLGAWIARRLRQETGLGAPGKAYAGLLLGALVTSALGASIGVLIWSWALPQAKNLPAEWWLWASTTFVGILLIAPVISSFADFKVKRSGGMPMQQFMAGALTFLLFFVVAALVFSGDVSDRFGASVGPTLTYLPLPFIVVTAILWQERGATIATLAGALALVAWTNSGNGPFYEVEGFVGQAVIEVQAYVAVMALLVGVVNALGQTVQLALGQARDWRTRYRQVLESSRTVVASFDAHSGAADWGDGTATLLRADPALLVNIGDLIGHADPAQQASLRSDWLALTQGRLDHVFWKLSLGWSDGRGGTVDARLSTVRGADGQVEQIAALLEVEAPHA